MTSDSTEMARRWRMFQDGLLASHDCAARADLDEQAVRWLHEGAIFSVELDEKELIPLFQFLDGAPIPAVKSVLQLLKPKATEWEIFGWFCQPDNWVCQGWNPKDLLLAAPETVIEAARHEVAEEWF